MDEDYSIYIDADLVSNDIDSIDLYGEIIECYDDDCDILFE